MQLRTTSLLLASAISAAFLATADNPSVFLPVYSPKSASPLHVAAIDTNTMAVVKSWEFPAEYTGHRSACFLPDAHSNMTFTAWTGGEAYNPGTDPFGTSRGYDYPVVDVTETSPITPRFDVWAAGVALYSLTNEPVVVDSSSVLGSSPVRVRVVRWKVNDRPRYNLAIEPRVVLDKVMDPRVATTLTEADFIDANAHDLDWEHFSDEVANYVVVVGSNINVVKADYLVVLGDGPFSWIDNNDTNTLVTASTQVITRRFNASAFHALDVAYEPATTGSCGAVSWNTCLPDGGWHTLTSSNVPPVALSVIYKDGLDAATMQGLMDGSPPSNIIFNVYATFRMPPQSEDGRWRWWPPSSFLVPGRVCGIFMGDAKHRPDAPVSTNGTMSVGDYSGYYIFSGLDIQERRPIFCIIEE
ncbi:MAG: hypothetical protein J6T51_06485 [Kiritimatiellae bacterium]|nr:hypothetical protein [Kiritimatiellia bacterium]